MNWSWNHGDPYMRGWGLIILLGLFVIMFSPVFVYQWRHRSRAKFSPGAKHD